MSRPPARLRCLPLEDRVTPAVITVDTPFDVVDPNDGKTSLREAIALANVNPDPFSPGITFAPELRGAVIPLTQVGGTTFGPSAFEITSRVGINGSGQKIVRANGAPDFRLFSVGQQGELSLQNVELVNGVAEKGGAVYNAGYFAALRTTYAGNTATQAGGAIYSTGPDLHIQASTITNNSAGSAGRGGGVYAVGSSGYWVSNTIADNIGRNEVELRGGSAATKPAMIIGGTIIARSGDGPIGTGDDANLVIDGYDPHADGWGGGNLIRSHSGYPGGIVSTADPLLGPLQGNGGWVEAGYTRTRALLPGSPAIDDAELTDIPFGHVMRQDQRGLWANLGGVDIGAFEYRLEDALPPSGNPPALVIPNAADLPVLTPPIPPPPTATVATGAAAGQPPQVVVYDQAGAELKRFLAYDPGFLGGVSVAVADVTGDGMADVITAAGGGGAPHVKVFDGVTFAEVRSFFAFDTNFVGGVSLAAGDITGDGIADIICGAGAGGAPHVKAFDGRTGAEVRSFFAYDPGFRGGVNVAVGPTGIVTGAGAGGAPHVKVFAADLRTELLSFMAYDPRFRGGVNVTSDGDDRIITGTGVGGAPHVKVFDWAITPDGWTQVADFFAADPTAATGVRVGAVTSGADQTAYTLVTNARGESEVRWFVIDWAGTLPDDTRTAVTEVPLTAALSDAAGRGSLGSLSGTVSR